MEETEVAIIPTLAVHMASHKLKPHQLAQKACISTQVIYKAIKGQRISHYSARQISEALRVPLTDIIGLNYSEERTNHHA